MDKGIVTNRTIMKPPIYQKILQIGFILYINGAECIFLTDKNGKIYIIKEDGNNDHKTN
jgi:hypothetical protein